MEIPCDSHYDSFQIRCKQLINQVMSEMAKEEGHSFFCK